MKVLSFKLGYITIKNEVRNQVCSQSKMETMEKNKLRLFCSPLSGPNFQARNLELVTQPNGPSASAILRMNSPFEIRMDTPWKILEDQFSATLLPHLAIQVGFSGV